MSQTLEQTTRLVADASRGDADAVAKLLPLVYDQLRGLAGRYLGQERTDHTLQPTALVHEAYLKLVDDRAIDYNGRTHFIGIAARAMRQVLIDHARHDRAIKRGGGRGRITLDNVLGFPEGTAVDFSHLTEALDRLAGLDDRKAGVVELRFFGGLTNEEVAQALGVSASTVERDWRVARAWLRRELSKSDRS